MKRTYIKPALYAESFELAEHISSCVVAPGNTVTYRDGASCSYTEGGLSLFDSGVSGCTGGYYEGENDPMYGSFEDFLSTMSGEIGGCYNAFSNGNFFAS